MELQEPLRITCAEVARNALALHEAGRLSAQAPSPICAYRTEQDEVEYACVVGASLPEPIASALDRGALNWRGASVGGTVSDLTRRGAVESDDADWLRYAQTLHDLWVQARGSWLSAVKIAGGGNHLERLMDEAEEKFLAHLRQKL